MPEIACALALLALITVGAVVVLSWLATREMSLIIKPSPGLAALLEIQAKRPRGKRPPPLPYAQQSDDYRP